MIKVYAFATLFISYILYSAFVYTNGTAESITPIAKEQTAIQNGKFLFQKHNCISCHQLYGLGGYLGPELTTAWSDPRVGEALMKTFLQYGGPRMPNFRFTKTEIDDIISFLRYVDSTASTYK